MQTCTHAYMQAHHQTWNLIGWSGKASEGWVFSECASPLHIPLQQLQHLGTKMDKVSTTQGGVIYRASYLIGVMLLFHQVSDQTIRAHSPGLGVHLRCCMHAIMSTHGSIMHTHICYHLNHANTHADVCSEHALTCMHACRHACCSGWEDGKGHEGRGSRKRGGLVSSICMHDSSMKTFIHGCMIATANKEHTRNMHA